MSYCHIGVKDAIAYFIAGTNPECLSHKSWNLPESVRPTHLHQHSAQLTTIDINKGNIVDKCGNRLCSAIFSFLIAPSLQSLAWKHSRNLRTNAFMSCRTAQRQLMKTVTQRSGCNTSSIIYINPFKFFKRWSRLGIVPIWTCPSGSWILRQHSTSIRP